MREFLYNLLYESTSEITPLMVLESMGVALVLALVLYGTYRLTFSGVVYSKKFNISLIMLTLVSAVVMNIIGSSVALSLGMVGALSIVRFRTAIKDPRDTAFIFWAICIGLGAGSHNYLIVAIGTLVIALLCIILSLRMRGDDKYLVIVRGNLENMDAVRAHIFGLYRACKLRAETVTSTYTELVYQVKLKDEHSAKDYEALQQLEGVDYVNIVAQNGETLG
ncbi:DUF4956 domain-containing protein [Christensenellaceae bacterium OttesenSCG-928-K19]|nr:DUF4956 domain-containing protein [Christensenellaceae bacterium OttesenSCG-928-K19]